MSEKTENRIIIAFSVMAFLTLLFGSPEFQKDFDNLLYAFILGIPVTAIGWLIYKYLNQYKKNE